MTTKIERKTHSIDAAGQVVGRLASQIALILRGKNKAGYTPHLDSGDFVEVKNISQIKLTGDKMRQKVYFKHGRNIGNVTQTTAKRMAEKRPDRILWLAVRGMMPANKLRPRQMKRLKISA